MQQNVINPSISNQKSTAQEKSTQSDRKPFEELELDAEEAGGPGGGIDPRRAISQIEEDY